MGKGKKPRAIFSPILGAGLSVEGSQSNWARHAAATGNEWAADGRTASQQTWGSSPIASGSGTTGRGASAAQKTSVAPIPRAGKGPVSADPAAKETKPTRRLSSLPDEVVETILVELSLVDINNLLAAADLVTSKAIKRNIYNPRNKEEARMTEIIAVIAQDNKLYKQGHLGAVRKALLYNLAEASSGAVSSIVISGSTCLMAKDLLQLASPKGAKFKRCPLLKNVEIHNSKTFSPIALLHHATKTDQATERESSFGDTTFTMTGTQMRWPRTLSFTYGPSTQLAVGFLYAYGAKLWHHFPSVFSPGGDGNPFGRWLNIQTMGAFLDPRNWKYIQRSHARRAEDETEDDPNGWENLTELRKEFANCFAIPIFGKLSRNYGRNPICKDRDYPCGSCNQRFPEFCYTDAQLKKHSSSGGICILCGYELIEDGADTTTLSKYNGKYPHPDELPQSWRHETLGCRSSVIPKKRMQFTAVGDEGESQVPENHAPSSEYNPEDEFCKGQGCEEQLDSEEMIWIGFCGPCQKKKKNTKGKGPSFKQIREAKRQAAAKVKEAEIAGGLVNIYCPPGYSAYDTEIEEQAPAVVADEQIAAEDLTSTSMGEEDVSTHSTEVDETHDLTSSPMEEEDMSTHSTELDETHDLTSSPMEEEDMSTHSTKIDEANTEVDAIHKDVIKGSKPDNKTLASRNKENASLAYNHSESGDIQSIAFHHFRNLSPDKYREQVEFYEESQKLSREGVKLCTLCKDRLKENETDKCDVCKSFPVCLDCGDDAIGGDMGLCARCVMDRRGDWGLSLLNGRGWY